MSTSWTRPDARPVRSGTVFGRPDERSEPAPPPVAHDVRAGVLVVLLTAVMGAPVGMLWAALAPHVPVEVTGTRVDVVDHYGDAFIAVDGYFFVGVVVAGVVSGLLARRFAAAHGPAVVVGLAAGGLVAADVAARVGAQIGPTARELVEAGAVGRQEVAVRLRSTPALVGWPVASLLTYVAAAWSRGR